MGNYCPYTNGNVVYLKCQECEDKICKKGWFFCGVGGTPMSMTKSRKQMSEYLDKMHITLPRSGAFWTARRKWRM